MNKRIAEELSAISRRNNGLLVAEHVVKAARDPKSALHDEFEWDDSEAADLYRLGQARRLIRMVVDEVPMTEKRSRIYVSLRRDRTCKGGGYRPVVKVMSDAQLRKEFLSEALDDLQTFEQKYASLSELADVFKAVRKARLMHKSDEGR